MAGNGGPLGSFGDDRLQYWLYPTGEVSLDDVLAGACELSAGYFWHHEGFNLRLQDGVWSGSSHFEDNIEDEWYLVSLLLQLSKRFPVAVRLCDSDGDVLLIEGADFLPRWVQPDRMDNRVFLFGGSLHLIPPPGKCNSLAKKPRADPASNDLPTDVSSPQAGAALISANPHLTMAPPKLQEAIERRLAGYHNDGGRRVVENRHWARAAVPPRLAVLLKAEPRFVTAAVRAFYLRDPFDLKACRELRHLGAGLATSPPLLRRVAFTRAAYAMLRQQAVAPDRRSAFHLPDRGDPDFGAWELGLKLTYGFEILASRAAEKGGGGRSKEEGGWGTFRASLDKRGFFRGEVEGSALWQELEAQARQFFAASVLPETERADPGMEVLERLSMIDASSIEELAKDARPLPPDDDDSWLRAVPDGLNGIPASANGAPDSDDVASPPEAPARPKRKRKGKKKLAADVKGFLAQDGPAADGVEAPRKSSGVAELEIPGASGNELVEEDSMDSYGEDELHIDLNEKDLKELNAFASTMSGYMASMDRELDPTTMGKSFAKLPPKGGESSKSTTQRLRTEEGRKSAASTRSGADSIDMEDDDFRAVDIDTNLVSNILTGYYQEQGQGGGAATALLRTLSIREGVEPPPLDSDDDDVHYEPPNM